MAEELLPKPETPTPLPEASTQTIKNENPAGRSPIFKFIILGIIVGLLIAGIVGAYVLGQSKSNQPSITTNVTPTPSPTPDPTADWKTFTTQSGASFKYPSDWIPKETITPMDSSGFGPLEEVNITSPNGFFVRYSDHIVGLGGGCDLKDCPYNHVLKAEPINIPGYGILYFVKLVTKDSNDSSVLNAKMGLIDPKTPGLKVGYQQSLGYYVMFPDKDPKKYLDQFYINIFSSNSKSDRFGQLSDLNQYFTDPEIQTAEKIIKTLSYN